MRIALFVIRNYLACHYALFGYRETLERMGHEVINCSFPSNQVQNWQQVPAPAIEVLQECDLVLSSYHEYMQPWLEKKYSLYQWQQLMKKVPVLARFDESMDRGDLRLPHRVPELLRWATHYSWPAAQDAEKYGGDWLPYGADTTIFRPSWHVMDDPDAACNRCGSRDRRAFCSKPEKRYDLAFIGTLYPKRHEYLMKLINHVGKNVTFYSGNVIVQDISGLRERETTQLLAENYREIRLFFCLPPMSRLLVEKIFDVMACDTTVFYPRLFGDAAKNLSIFEEEKHIVYYELGFFANNGKQVRYYLEHPEEAERIARDGGELVRSKFTLEKMLEAMLAQVGSARESTDKVRV